MISIEVVNVFENVFYVRLHIQCGKLDEPAQSVATIQCFLLLLKTSKKSGGKKAKSAYRVESADDNKIGMWCMYMSLSLPPLLCVCYIFIYFYQSTLKVQAIGFIHCLNLYTLSDSPTNAKFIRTTLWFWAVLQATQTHIHTINRSNHALHHNNIEGKNSQKYVVVLLRSQTATKTIYPVNLISICV